MNLSPSFHDRIDRFILALDFDRNSKGNALTALFQICFSHSVDAFSAIHLTTWARWEIVQICCEQHKRKGILGIGVDLSGEEALSMSSLAVSFVVKLLFIKLSSSD